MILSKEDEHLINFGKWYEVKGRHTSYLRCHLPGSGRENQKKVYLHHMVAGMPLPGYEVDHINRNGLDNRRENLRVVPKGINRANAVIYKNNKTGYRGVRLSACGKKFLACITTNGKSQHLGTFDTAEAASRAYLQKKGKR